MELWLQSQIASTRRVYAVALRDFAKAIQADTTAAVELLLAGRGPANALALAYRTDLQRRSKANPTINLRLAALRSLVHHARRLEVIDWALEVNGVPARAYRDTRGPGRAHFRRMLEVCRRSPTAARDTAILWTLYGLALRRGEAAALDLADVISKSAP